MKVHVIGASGRSGAALCRALAKGSVNFVPVVRNTDRWAATGLAGVPRIADLGDAAAVQSALQDAEKIVSCAHARHAPTIIAAAPPGARFVFLGSTRKFTRWPDAHGNGVRAGEAAFLASGRPGVMLHPTMIYGAEGEDNVQRLAALLRKIPFVPLPEGGRALVQPIHQADVTASIRAALATDWPSPETLVIAGPAPLAYADFVRAVAQAAGLPRPRILSVPAAPLRLAARLAGAMPFLPRIGPDEIRRLTEDKAFPIGPMLAHLGVTPRPLDAGLASIGW
jgi:uncharacterized protein YbjT (DUF2867 family)